MKFNNVQLLHKVKINGETGYDFQIEGKKMRFNSEESLRVVAGAKITNAIVVGGKYIRLKKGKLTEEIIITTTIRRNGLAFINPLVKIEIPERKFTEYCLNPKHNIGKNKARVFESALGYNLSNYKGLIEEIRRGIYSYPVTNVEASEHGLKYTVVMSITGPYGRSSVLTGWIEVIDGHLRLTSAYVNEKRRG